MKPWEKEPNELVWEAHGFHCRLARGPMGHWCGYVGVDENHPLYGKGYGESLDVLKPLQEQRLKEPLGETPSLAVMMSILTGGEFNTSMDMVFNVHGGVTFAGKYPKENLWLIGFDCAHSGDLCPESNYSSASETYRTLEYAKAETERLAAQIAKIKEG
jgi:hypothetical protein